MRNVEYMVKVCTYMILRLTTLCTLILGIQINLSSQTLSGKVLDGYTNPIVGAYIYHSSTKSHKHTDETGNFQFTNLSINDTLILSHIGYKQETIILKNLDQKLTIFLEEKINDLDEILITGSINAVKLITDIDAQINQVNSSQDILKKVPGLFIGQHAGGGKAEQIFLRGFDIDHGTDINITVDEMPVNMVSHAHGQGYADLHFIIPETIEKVDLGKGPYYTNKGNFNTAGYINFSRKHRLDDNLIKLEAGQFNTQRLLGMFNLLDTKKQSSYVAMEYMAMDGPFESPQHFGRTNLFGRYTAYVNKYDKIDLSLSHFVSKWDASGQIPQRAVESGQISRFGAIDDTEGGNTSRSNIILNYKKFINEKSSIKNTAYFTRYGFELFSNFTFFLEDSINGDQIRQVEDRTMMGMQSEYKQFFTYNNMEGFWNAGISIRNDQSRGNELAYTRNRKETLSEVQSGDIDETNFGVFLGNTLEIGKWTVNPGIRVDYFSFQYQDALATQYSTQKELKAIASPKLNVFYNPINELQFYIKVGQGFHTNDTRVVIENQGNQILPPAIGFDIGNVWKLRPDLLINTAYWYLFLEQEFVYVGDAGIVEPSGQTLRQGVDLSLRYQPASWLYCNLDAHYTNPRSIDEEAGENYIPLAADFTLMGSLTVKTKSGFYGSSTLRVLGDRPANEDYSIVAEGYTVVDINAGYKWKNFDIGFQIQNLFNTAWNETQFATESRLAGEINSVEEIHFTPGTPFFAKGMLAYRF